MYILFLAGRYTLARPVSYLAMVAIGLAVMALIVVVSIMNGFLDETRSFLRGTTADIVVAPLYERSRTSSREVIEDTVRSHPAVEGVAARLVRPAVFKMHGRKSDVLNNSKYADLTQILVLGIDPEIERDVSGFDDYLDRVEGDFIRVDDPADPFRIDRGEIRDPRLRYAGLPVVVLGATLMRSLGLGKGDAIELVTVPESASLDGDTIKHTSQTFIVAGGFDSGHHSFDQSSVYTSREDFQSWAQLSHGASELAVKLVPGTAPEAFDRARDEIGIALSRAGVEASVETWRDRHSIWLNAVENERNILIVIFLFFLLLVCTISYSVLTMMVHGKVRDIGILSAVGAPTRGVGLIFATCGVYIATLGGLFGLGAGTLLASKVNTVKDIIEELFGIQIFNKEVYAFSEIPATIHHDLDLLIAGVTIVGAVVICLFPAWRAARLNPVEALRHD